MANKETRVLKSNTFEEFRQKTNEVSLHLGDNEQLNASLSDKTFNYNNVSAGETLFAGLDVLGKTQEFSIKPEETLDNTGGYIILTGSPSIAGFVADAILTQAGGYSATIVSASTDKILVKNSSGTFSSSENLVVGGDSIAASAVLRIVAEAFPLGVVRVYVNNTEITQDLNAGGFHVPNYQARITLLNTPTVSFITEGSTVYQGTNLGSASFSGTVLSVSATELKLKNYTGTFNTSTAIKMDGSSSTITGANHGVLTILDIAQGNAIVLNTPATLNDDIKVFAPNLVDVVNELQDDVGITENLTTAAGNLVDAVNEIEAVFDASTHEISAGSTAFNVTSGEFTIDSSADIVLDADGGNVELKDNGTQYGSLTNTAGNIIVKSGTSTMLTGSGANATFARDVTVTRDVDVDRNLNVDGTSSLVGNVTITGITDVGQLNDKFTNRNDVKLALNELHTEMGTAAITGTNTPAAGLSNLTDGLNAIDAEIGATAYLAGTGLNATITFAVDAIQDYVGTYSSGIPVVNTVSTTITGALNQLHTEMGSSTLVDNLPTDYAYNVTDHTTAINTLSAFTGNSSIASIGSTDTLTGALVQLHGEIGDGAMTGLTATNISAAVRELETEKVYLASGTQQEIDSKLGLTGNVTFKDGGTNRDTMTFNSGTTLDLSNASLLLPGNASNVNIFSTSFLEVDGNVQIQGFSVDRQHVTTITDKADVRLQWNENHADGTSTTKPARSWQFVGLDDASASHTTDIVTFYNAKELITNNTESGINVTWDASSETFDFNVNDPTITLGTGPISGNVTITNLGNATFNTTLDNNSVALTTHTTGDYVRTVAGTANQITVTGTGTEGRAATFSIPTDFRAPGTVKILGTTASGSTSTGALTVAGGVGIGEDLYVAGDLYVEGNRVELNVSTLEVEDSIIVTNSLNASVGQFGLGVNNSSGNIDHSLYYNYSNNQWEADGVRILDDVNSILTPQIKTNNGANTDGNLTITDITGARDLNFLDGTGIDVRGSLSGTDINITVANTDKGSSQAIFKNFTAGSGGTATANINNDTINFPNGSQINTVRVGDTITINHADTSTLNGTYGQAGAEDGTYIKSVTVDSNGHLTGVTSDDFDNRYDNYGSWQLWVNNVSQDSITSGERLGFDEGAGIDLAWDGNDITISHQDTSNQGSVNNSGRTYIQDIALDTFGHITSITSATESYTYTHPSYTARSINTSGAAVLDVFTSDTQGHVTNITTRNMTLADLGYTGATNANNFTYTHPAYNGDDISIDTGALTGATVISDLDFNITTNTLGHVTDANATVATRNLTLANLGYTGATNANNYSFPYTITSAATANTVVHRTTGGNFSAGTITATLSGNATSSSSCSGNAATSTKTYVTNRTTENVAYYLTGVPGSLNGYNNFSADAAIYMKPSTNGIYATTFFGALSGNASSASTAAACSGNTAGSSSSCTGNSATATTAGTCTGNSATATYATSAGSAGSATSSTTVFVNNYNSTTTMRVLGSHNGISTQGNVYSTSSIYMNMSTNRIYATDVVATSDERLKDRVGPIENALDKVNSLEGFLYTWNDKYTGTDDSVQVGVSAQQVEKVLPEAVDELETGYKGVAYDKLVPLLIEAMKELTQENKLIRAELENLKSINT